jgi:hypothetical protein
MAKRTATIEQAIWNAMKKISSSPAGLMAVSTNT